MMLTYSLIGFGITVLAAGLVAGIGLLFWGSHMAEHLRPSQYE